MRPRDVAGICGRGRDRIPAMYLSAISAVVSHDDRSATSKPRRYTAPQRMHRSLNTLPCSSVRDDEGRPDLPRSRRDRDGMMLTGRYAPRYRRYIAEMTPEMEPVHILRDDM